jgi:putative MATE family efflux protein
MSLTLNNPNHTNSFGNILRIAIPLMISGLSMSIVNLTDTMFLSQLGATELGGAGNALLLLTVLLVIGMGFSTGAQIILARRNGERNYFAIGSIIQHSWIFMLIWSVIVILFLFYVLPLFSHFIIDSTEIRNVIHEYLNARSWGIIFNSLNIVFVAFFVGVTKTKIIGFITPLIAVVNIGLDYLLIFGGFGIPTYGVAGAAYASNISEMLGTLIFFLFAFFVFKHSKYKLFVWQGVDWKRYRIILKISSPVMIQNFIALAAWFVFFTLIEHLGEKELAASHIIRSIYMVLIIPVFGLGDTINSLTGNLLGQGHSNSIFRLLKNTNIIGFLYCLALQPLFYIFGEQIFAPFTSDLQIIEMGLPTMKVVFSALFIFTSIIVGFRVISGAGKTMVGLAIESFTVVIYLLSAWYLAQLPEVELYVVWLSEFIYFGLFLLMVYPYLWWGNWKELKL